MSSTHGNCSSEQKQMVSSKVKKWRVHGISALIHVLGKAFRAAFSLLADLAHRIAEAEKSALRQTGGVVELELVGQFHWKPKVLRTVSRMV